MNFHLEYTPVFTSKILDRPISLPLLKYIDKNSLATYGSPDFHQDNQLSPLG